MLFYSGMTKKDEAKALLDTLTKMLYIALGEREQRLLLTYIRFRKKRALLPHVSRDYANGDEGTLLSIPPFSLKG